MKFINYLQSIEGVGIFPLISLLIFFIFFSLLVVWALKVKDEHINEMKNIPFDNTNETSKL